MREGTGGIFDGKRRHEHHSFSRACHAFDGMSEALQKRFIHVITTDEAGFAKTAMHGVNGIITDDFEKAYGFLSCFDENSLLRRVNLYAHKGFSCDGKYSENTITSVTAAGKNHFDGAEIDVKLTSDDVAVVMHNVDTRGLFDCEVMRTEETDYKTLSSLRRIGFPEESIDRFDDLMYTMKAYEDTPVLIELKPSAKYNNLEKLIRIVTPVLNSKQAQQDPVCIMGALDPGHAFVHRKLPKLPLAYCEGADSMPDAPENRADAEACIYRIARLTAGCAAGYNAEDVKMNRLLKEYAKFRMITVFPWSKGWTLEPSKWEKNGPGNVKTYLSGYDAWTADHGEKFWDLPVSIERDEETVENGTIKPVCRMIFRDGHSEKATCSLKTLSGKAEKTSDGVYTVSGRAEVMLEKTIGLYFGETYKIYSGPFEISGI